MVQSVKRNSQHHALGHALGRTRRQARVKAKAIDLRSSNIDRTRLLATLTMLAAALMLCASAFAQNTTLSDAPDAPPPLTAEDLQRAVNADAAQPATRTRTTTNGVVTEYRDGNRTYLIQVDPKTGARYYMNDADGNGSPESYRDNAESDVNIGKWKITSW